MDALIANSHHVGDINHLDDRGMTPLDARLSKVGFGIKGQFMKSRKGVRTRISYIKRLRVEISAESGSVFNWGKESDALDVIARHIKQSTDTAFHAQAHERVRVGSAIMWLKDMELGQHSLQCKTREHLKIYMTLKDKAAADLQGCVSTMPS